MTALDKARDAFLRHFGEAPDGIVFAPGRVNLIGDHVDYCDGLVLPMPLPLGTAVAWRARAGDGVRVVAADFADGTDDFRPGDAAEPECGWRSYVRGMAAILVRPSGQRVALDLAIAGDLPRGAGLSSSASLCVALGRAVAAAGLAQGAHAVDIARAAQRTEHDYAGVACGIMDQMASACGLKGHAMLLDCRDLSWRATGLPVEWAVLVVPSGVSRGLVDGEYNLRREQCESAARKLGIGRLRDATDDMLAVAGLDPVERSRATHVVAEISRVRAAAAAMERRDLAAFGACLNASHASLRDLFEVSHPEVDRLVALIQQALGDQGGARMTGGGFGGAVVAVVPRERVEHLRNVLDQSYSHEASAQMLVIEPMSNENGGV
jgi:galactokinase